MGEKLPSPCIDVCKFKMAGHCVGCGMTKKQKKKFKKTSGKKARRAFILDLFEQQQGLGRFRHWAILYGRKCRKKGVAYPFD